MTFDIHVTVELQPSPQLLQLLQSWQSADHKIRPQPGPQDSELPVKPTIGDLDALLQPGPGQPQIKPQEAGEQPKGPAPEPHEPQKWDPLVEIPRFPISACTTPEHIPVPGMSPRFEYIETDDQRLWLRYISANIWTTWEHIMKLEQSLPANQKKFGKLLGRSDIGNRRTAINYMIRAIRAGLQPGQAAGGHDPDADFRPMLNQNTRIAQDGGKLEGSLEV